MSGDTFHGSAVTTYTDGRAMLDPVNDHVAPDIYVPGTGTTTRTRPPRTATSWS